MTYRDSQAAFLNAIASGRLSSDPEAKNYAGNYMYMNTDTHGVDQFKHIDTRQYLGASLHASALVLPDKLR